MELWRQIEPASATLDSLCGKLHEANPVVRGVSVAALAIDNAEVFRGAKQLVCGRGGTVGLAGADGICPRVTIGDGEDVLVVRLDVEEIGVVAPLRNIKQ